MTRIPPTPEEIEGEVLPPPTPEAILAHRDMLMRALGDLQDDKITPAEAERIIAGSREFHRRVEAWEKAGGAIATPGRRDLERALRRLAAGVAPRLPAAARRLPTHMRLTKRSVEQLPAPAVDVVVWDDTLNGFGVRVLPSGRRTWIVQKRTRSGRSIRLKIGRDDELTAEQARDEAKRIISRVALGEDPAAERRATRQAERERRAAPTLAQLAEDWVADRKPHWRPASRDEIERQLRQTILPALGRLKAETLTPKRVKDLHTELSARAPILANRVKSTIVSMIAWAASQDDWKALKPVHRDLAEAKIKRNPEQRRERYPSNGELKRLVQVLHSKNGLGARFFLFLLLTGARRGEAENMRWADVDLDAGVWTKPAGSTKQKRVHRLPLSPEAVDLLRQVQLAEPFAPFMRLAEWRLRQAWVEILREARISDLRVHDLRHWHASLLASMGLSLPIIGALLGHSSPSTTARYAHLLDEALRQATDRVGEIVRLPVKKTEG